MITKADAANIGGSGHERRLKGNFIMSENGILVNTTSTKPTLTKPLFTKAQRRKMLIDALRRKMHSGIIVRCAGCGCLCGWSAVKRYRCYTHNGWPVRAYIVCQDCIDGADSEASILDLERRINATMGGAE